jgi:hypothetical protein
MVAWPAFGLNKKNAEKAKFLCTEIKDLHNRSHGYPQIFPAADFCGTAAWR